MTRPRLLSPSRLNDFLGCAHREALRLAGVPDDVAPDPSGDLIRAKGMTHEAAVLAWLKEQHGDAVVIPDDGSVEDRAAATGAAMAAGASLIFQGALRGERWLGFCDFLVRRDGPDGHWYEPQDAKLARSMKPSFAVQLAVYADLLAEAGWRRPDRGAILLGGDDGPVLHSQRLDRVRAIVGRLKARYEAFVEDVARQTRPVPCAACGLCPYQQRCEAQWREEDALVFVAGVTAGQRDRLETKGVATLEALATCALDHKAVGIGEDAFERIRQQASLQKAARDTGQPQIQLRPVEAGQRRGFALLPPPSEGDLFYDIEGNPLHPGGGLEYLHGIWGPLGGGTARYSCWWAHDRAGEKAAFEALVDALDAHFARFPDAHLYHYAPYERTALRNLAMRHATREASIDRMLHEKRLVDLYVVVRQGVMVSTENYSIKSLEILYDLGREGDAVAGGGDSIVAYETWRETGDDTILEQLRAYNETDVVSTAQLRDWLLARRPAAGQYIEAGQEGKEQPDDADRALHELAAAVRGAEGLEAPRRETLAELLWFHQRADKPQWWAVFDRADKDADELADDLETIVGLTPDGPMEAVKQSRQRWFRFPEQPTKLRSGADVRVVETGMRAGTIEAFDAVGRRVLLKVGKKAPDWPDRFAIGARGPLPSDHLKAGVQATARLYADGLHSPIQALADFLGRGRPRLDGYGASAPIVPHGMDMVAGVTNALQAMQETCLFIQGPPGTGKTYTVSRAIADLLAAGKTVAVSSNSHKAINNLLGRVEEAAAARGHSFSGFKIVRSDDEAGGAHEGPFISTVPGINDVPEEAQLVGATVFALCRVAEPRFDYLVIDEAGQVSLGNLAAMARCARNIVLVGDQMQLPQPVQGVHPGESGLSLLDYLLEGQATVAPDFGILLDVSWRMHPALCSFISGQVYDGRLRPHADTASRELVLSPEADPGLRTAGLSFVPVSHTGNTQESQEEAERIAALVESLLSPACRWSDGTGRSRRLKLEDILIVAPYNMQVQRLAAALPDGARVGTVDKFQGQEAPVAIVSMTTSTPEEAPRGASFLLNRQRLNVALSRAKSLAILVASPALADWPARTVEEMELASFLVAAMELGR